jgi:hypothetical protein
VSLHLRDFFRWQPYAALTLLLTAGNAPAQSIWRAVTTPDIGSITSMSADAEDDIWAVGIGGVTGPVKSLHFDGTKWSAIPMIAGQLRGVAVISPVNVWAVGQTSNGNSSQIEHFDGLRWAVFPSPHFASEHLNAIRAVTANDIYAAGSFLDSKDQSRHPLIEHFDGTSWTVMPTTGIAAKQGLDLLGIAIVSPVDIWAVGATSGGSLAIHFNGTQWKRVAVPVSASLTSVAAISSHDVWAVGVALSGPVTAHWDGISWHVVPSPSLFNAGLASVAAISHVDVWATGCNPCGDAGGGPPLIEHWDGIKWSISPTTIIEGGDNGGAVLAFPSGSVYTGGTALGTSTIDSFVLHTTRGL